MGSHGGRDTVEEKKSSSQPGQGAGGGGTGDRLARTHTRTHAHTLGLHTVQRPRSSTLPSSCQRKGRVKREGGRGRGPPGSNPARNRTRIGCLAGKGRLLSVLTDPAALVPDRGGTVDQSHALSCRSTAHLVCNPHALPPWPPASLPTLPPTCSLMPSLVGERWADQLNGNGACGAVQHSTVQPWVSYSSLFFSFFAFSSRLLCLSCQPMHPTQGSHQFETFRLPTRNERPSGYEQTNGWGRVSDMQTKRAHPAELPKHHGRLHKVHALWAGPRPAQQDNRGAPHHTTPYQTTPHRQRHHTTPRRLRRLRSAEARARGCRRGWRLLNCFAAPPPHASRCCTV